MDGWSPGRQTEWQEERGGRETDREMGTRLDRRERGRIGLDGGVAAGRRSREGPGREDTEASASDGTSESSVGGKQSEAREVLCCGPVAPPGGREDLQHV